MSNIAIRVEGLGKMYRIGGKQERYRTLRDTLTDAFAAPFRRAGSLLRGQAYGAADLKEEIWALKDVSFEVKHGEVVGIIGRNGAGKSTLLKILSRITEPTEGYADVYGRVGSLLEVGTGFHPELTGRENIYLNGAILGMSRAEIDRKFDEIVAFAEIEKFIDTPVKHYSSGMGLRLGFAVAAHLEPEILVVDEVLAVGDAQFQKKCLGKMSEVAGEGRTVLFVSHNMAAVRSLCKRGLMIEEGHVVIDADSDTTIKKYQQSILNKDSNLATTYWSCSDMPGECRVLSVIATDSKGCQLDVVRTWDEVHFRIKIVCDYDIRDAGVELAFDTLNGERLLKVTTKPFGTFSFSLPAKKNTELVVIFPHFPLAAGRYLVSIGVTRPLKGFVTKGMVPLGILEVDATMVFGGTRPLVSSQSLFTCEHFWEISQTHE